MQIEQIGYGNQSPVKITLTAAEANDLALDEYSYILTDLRDQLVDLGYGENRYEISGTFDITVSFTGYVNAASEEDARDRFYNSLQDAPVHGADVSADIFDEGDPEVDFCGDGNVTDVDIHDVEVED